MAPNDGIAEFLAALADTEWLASDKLRLYRRRLLERLLRHARAETDFYADRLAPVFRADDSIDWDRWGELPILTRPVAQANSAALAARTRGATGRTIEAATSGSTGRPFRHLTSQMQGTASLCAYERVLNWHRIDPAGLLAMIRALARPTAPYPDGQLHRGARLLHPEATAITLDIATPIPQQLEWLGRIKPRTLLSYPSNLSEIARQAATAGVRIAVDAVITAGELTTDDARTAIRDYFGREPIDVYGSTEVGHIAATCPHSGLHHVAAELLLTEIIDEAGNPVPDGTPGRLIVTPFYNHAMPLIRYELGDYAVMAATPCGCGRTLPTLSKVLGRARNVFRYVDGSASWPNVRSWEIADFVRFQQYQLVQVTRTRLELRYVPQSPEQPTADLDGLNAYLRRRLHPSVEATLVPMDAIPRSAGGKFEDCMSLVEGPPGD